MHAAHGHESYLGVPIRMFGGWVVTTGGVETRFGSYDIYWQEVWNSKWEKHVKRNDRLPGTYQDFLQALNFARLFFPASGAYDPDEAHSYQQQYRPVSEDWFQEKRIHTALGGLRVRSKSEVIIANLLTTMQIPFTYEQRLEASDGTYRFPDFTLCFNERTCYWEHLGMMEQVEYVKRCDVRLQWYRDHRLAHNLIVTTEVGGLDCDSLVAIVRHKMKMKNSRSGNYYNCPALPGYGALWLESDELEEEEEPYATP